MLESTFREDWDEIGSNRAKKGHLLLKSTIFSKLAGCQWVKPRACATTTVNYHAKNPPLPPEELELSVKRSIEPRLGGDISYFILKNEKKKKKTRSL